MAHELDFSNEQTNIAVRYEGTEDTPWHGLGQRLLPGQSIETWAQAAGLAHTVISTPVLFNASSDIGGTATFSGKQVLYRSDTKAPLSVVSDGYNIVQPAQVLGFFDELCKHNGFTLETAGSLAGGRRVWALAKVSEGAPVISEDVVKPYVLLATSYDGTLATTARFTTIRVVCQNTLSASDREDGNVVRVSHSRVFDAADARIDLGIAFSAFDKFLIDARKLAKREVNEKFAAEFLRQLLPAPVKTELVNGRRVVTPQPIEESRAYLSIIDLFRGAALGHSLNEAKGSAWSLLNAVTQHVDHLGGRSDSTRLSSAWFGNGDTLKSRARDLLLEVVG